MNTVRLDNYLKYFIGKKAVVHEPTEGLRVRTISETLIHYYRETPDAIKPLLRPFSDFSLHDLNCIFAAYERFIGEPISEDEKYTEKALHSFVSDVQTMGLDGFQFEEDGFVHVYLFPALCDLGFDVFGRIQKGLAVDATTFTLAFKNA